MRALTDSEITALKTNGCRAENWRTLRVAENFSPAKIFATNFRGDCALNFSVGEIENSTLNNCRIENGARITHSTVENYAVGKNAKIHAVAELSHRALRDSHAQAAHGIGQRIEVLRESGGIEIIAHPDLSAPIAWLQAFANFSHSRRQRWQKMIDRQNSADRTKTDGRGQIGEGAEITAAKIIRDTQIEVGAKISGADFIANSTIAGQIGSGAVIKNSIVALGAFIGDGCHLEKCFVGDGANLDDHFHAEHSLFFANCDCRRGEADALFAAPFTVSHHQPTLLIAALTSFFNAGSGTNFSNHQYKLGARHFGILERGCKCGLLSTLTLPGRVGVFSTVIGQHRAPFDSSIFPFSQIREQDGESILLPGANLFGIGIDRDERKWRDRDRRFDKTKNFYHAAVWSPVIAEQVEHALAMLKENSSPIGLTIPSAYRHRAVERYENGLAFYYGEILSEQSAAVLKKIIAKSDLESKKDFHSATNGDREWLDLGGVIAKRSRIAELLERIDCGKITSYAAVNIAFAEIYRAFADDEIRWIAAKKIDRKKISASLKKLQQEHATAKLFRAELLAKDAAKENAEAMRMNYGLFAESARDQNFAFINGN